MEDDRLSGFERAAIWTLCALVALVLASVCSYALHYVPGLAAFGWGAGAVAFGVAAFACLGALLFG
jgi:hypothetical protein